MKKFLFLNKHKLLLINFDQLFSDISINYLNDLNEYGLITDYKIKITKLDAKKLLYHHVTYGICEEIKNNKHDYKKIIVIPPEIRPFHEILDFCNKHELENILYGLLKKLQKTLPFVIYFSDSYIFQEDFDNTGEGEEVISILKGKLDKLDNSLFTYEKIKTFANKFDLTFLSKEYFDDIKTRLLLQ